MEHCLIKGGGEQFLPFARSRIRALRAMGMSYASQKFEVDDATIRVRIEPGHEYIEIEGADEPFIGAVCALIEYVDTLSGYAKIPSSGIEIRTGGADWHNYSGGKYGSNINDLRFARVSLKRQCGSSPFSDKNIRVDIGALVSGGENSIRVIVGGEVKQERSLPVTSMEFGAVETFNLVQAEDSAVAGLYVKLDTWVRIPGPNVHVDGADDHFMTDVFDTVSIEPSAEYLSIKDGVVTSSIISLPTDNRVYHNTSFGDGAIYKLTYLTSISWNNSETGGSPLHIQYSGKFSLLYLTKSGTYSDESIDYGTRSDQTTSESSVITGSVYYPDGRQPINLISIDVNVVSTQSVTSIYDPYLTWVTDQVSVISFVSAHKSPIVFALYKYTLDQGVTFTYELATSKNAEGWVLRLGSPFNVSATKFKYIGQLLGAVKYYLWTTGGCFDLRTGDFYWSGFEDDGESFKTRPQYFEISSSGTECNMYWPNYTERNAVDFIELPEWPTLPTAEIYGGSAIRVRITKDETGEKSASYEDISALMYAAGGTSKAFESPFDKGTTMRFPKKKVNAVTP